MANREEIIEKIRALRAKAEDAAATESEAMSAAEMAARLLVKHDIKPEELAEVAKSEGTVSGFRQGKTLHPVAEQCAYQIMQFTETRAYINQGEVRFIGLEEDVMMAVYLIEMLTGAAKRAWIDYAEGLQVKKFAETQRRRVSYFHGFAVRVSQRLQELKAFRDAQRQAAQGASNSTALVVVKSEIIRRTMEEKGINISGVYKSRAVRYDDASMTAGFKQGDNVNLGRPMGSTAAMGGLVE